jgi:hypothetical protein
MEEELKLFTRTTEEYLYSMLWDGNPLTASNGCCEHNHGAAPRQQGEPKV